MSRFQSKKLSYSISEASKITEVPHYLIRKWEKIFSKLSPSRNNKGNRFFTNKDISIILSIKKAIKSQGYTIEKAKEIIDGTPTANPENNVNDFSQKIETEVTSSKSIKEKSENLRGLKELVLEALGILKEIEEDNISNQKKIEASIFEGNKPKDTPIFPEYKD